jgi:UDP-N-acetylglucosamine acyltransferase
LIQVHPTALVDPKARLADGVSIGPFSIVEADVEIGEGTRIYSHVLVADGARIGKQCQIHHGSVVSSVPQDLKFAGEETLLEIGDHTVIREFCDLNRGTRERGKSKIGSHCYTMAYAHVGHDCFIGDKVLLANGVQLAGHVTIEERVSVGGMVPVHQFCSIGQHAFIGGGFRVVQDVPPFILAAGEPLTYKGLNIVGLRRRNFSQETIAALRKCYRFIYQSKLNTSQAIEKISTEMEPTAEIKAVLEFIQKSERGVIR